MRSQGSGGGKVQRFLDQAGNVVKVDEQWRRDTDGRYFYSFLTSPWAAIVTADTFKNQLDPWRKLTTLALRQWRNDFRKITKYLWLARYYNSVCDIFHDAGLERISFDECF